MYLFTSERKDLHLRHTGYKPVALLTELRSIMGCDQCMNETGRLTKEYLLNISAHQSALLSYYHYITNKTNKTNFFILICIPLRTCPES